MIYTDVCKAGAKNLAGGIVSQAAEDYKSAFLGEKVDKQPPDKMMKSCERFFHSEYYRNLTDIDGDWLIHNLKINALEDVAMKFKRFLTGKNTEITLRVPKGYGQKPMVFTVPPKFKSEFKALINKIQKDLECEREVLIKERNDRENNKKKA